MFLLLKQAHKVHIQERPRIHQANVQERRLLGPLQGQHSNARSNYSLLSLPVCLLRTVQETSQRWWQRQSALQEIFGGFISWNHLAKRHLSFGSRKGSNGNHQQMWLQVSWDHPLRFIHPGYRWLCFVLETSGRFLWRFTPKKMERDRFTVATLPQFLAWFPTLELRSTATRHLKRNI